MLLIEQSNTKVRRHRTGRRQRPQVWSMAEEVTAASVSGPNPQGERAVTESDCP